MSKILSIHAREILDSRGNPTVEVDVINLAIIPAAPINNTTQPPFKNSGIKSFKFFKILLFIYYNKYL